MLSRSVSLFKDLLSFAITIVLGIGFLAILSLFGVWHVFVRICLFISKRKKFADFLSPQDLYFLALENKFPFHQYPKKVLLGAVTLEGNVNLEEFRSKAFKVVNQKNENGDMVFGRLQQFISPFMGYKIFQWDRNFDIKDHVREIQMPVTEENFLTIVQAELYVPFIENTSMWEVILAPNYNNTNNTMLFFRIQHCFGDGTSMIRLLNGAYSEIEASRHNPTNERHVLQKSEEKGSIRLTLKRFYENTIGLPRQFMTEQFRRRNIDSRSYTQDFHLVKLPAIPLDKFKEIKATTGITFTTAITTSLSYALSLTVNKTRNGRPVPEYITAILPLPLPQISEKNLGNSFYPVDYNVSLRRMSLDERLATCDAELEIAKSSKSPQVIKILGQATKVLPFWISQKIILSSERQLQGLLISNIMGPQQPISIFGHKVLELYWCHSAVENPWLIAAIISYNGKVQIGFAGLACVFGNEEKMKQFAVTLPTD